jgi:hypothetical protein
MVAGFEFSWFIGYEEGAPHRLGKHPSRQGNLPDDDTAFGPYEQAPGAQKPGASAEMYDFLQVTFFLEPNPRGRVLLRGHTRKRK